MTAAANSPGGDFIEDGISLVHPIACRFLSGSIEVTRYFADGRVLKLVNGIDYNTSGGDTDAGGTLIKSSAGVSGTRLRWRRLTPRSQGIDFKTSDTFPADANERGLDVAMLIDQEQDFKIKDLSQRALILQEGETATELPSTIGQGGKFLALNANRQPYWASGTGPDAALRNDLAISGAALIGINRGSLQNFINADQVMSLFGNDRAAFLDLLAASATNSSAVIDTPVNLGATPVANPKSVVLRGNNPVSYDPNDNNGARVLNPNSRNDALLKWGQFDALHQWHRALSVVGSIRKIAWFGDSNADGFMGQALRALLLQIPGVTIVNYAVGGTGSSYFLNTAVPLAIAAGGFTLVVNMYGGTNEPQLNNNIDNFDAQMRAGMAALQAAMPLGQTSYIMLTANCARNVSESVANPRGDHADGRWLVVATARVKQISRDFRTALWDKYGHASDAWIDIAGPNPLSMLDSYGLHTVGFTNALLAYPIFRYLCPEWLMTDTISSRGLVRGSADLPASYTDAVTVRIGTDPGYPTPMIVITLKIGESNNAVQLGFNWTSGETNLSVRLGSNNVWTPWRSIVEPGTAGGSVVPSAGWTAGAPPMTIIRQGNVGTGYGSFAQTVPAIVPINTVIGTIPTGFRPTLQPQRPSYILSSFTGGDPLLGQNWEIVPAMILTDGTIKTAKATVASSIVMSLSWSGMLN
jgi:hypothetical protein